MIFLRCAGQLDLAAPGRAQVEVRLCFVGAQLLFLLILVNYYVGFDISKRRYSPNCTYGILSLDISLFLFTQLIYVFIFMML